MLSILLSSGIDLINDEAEDEFLIPEKISHLEEKYISLLLDNPKAISMYYILYDDCFFNLFIKSLLLFIRR